MLKKERYFKAVKRPYPPLYSSLIMMGYVNPDNFKGLLVRPFSLANVVQVDSAWNYDMSEVEQAGLLALESWSDSSLFEFNKKELDKREQILIDSTSTNFEDFTKAYQSYIPSAVIVFSADKPVAQALRKALLLKRTPVEVDKLMDQLNIPLRDNFHKQEEYDLVVCEDVSAHVKKYNWLYSRYGLEIEYSIVEATEKLKNINKVEYLKKREEEKKELIETIATIKKILGNKSWLVDIFQFIIFYRTHRTDVINKASFLAIPMLKKLAAKFQISYKQILYCTANEILNKNLPSLEIINNRIEDFALIMEDKKIFIVEGEKCRQINNYFKEKTDSSAIVKGNVACKGIAKGTVKIVFKSNDFDKFNTGDILVASMTTPEMVPIMKKASAFITDEGGVTCHAAIISRELKKPCIIGTRIATQVLKDGDLVELDTETGVVKVIK